MIKVKTILNIITYLCVLTGYLSVAEYLGIYHSIVFIALLALAAWLDYSRMLHLPRWLINIASVLVIGLSSFRISPDYLVEPILEALIILIAIKLIEDKEFRDYMQIYGMCMFLLIGSSLVSLSPVFLIYFLIISILSTVSLVLLAYFSHDPEMALDFENVSKIILHSLLICAIAIPSSAFFFLILPRTNYPLFSFLNKLEGPRTGFSDSVTLGEVSAIQEDNSTVFRAETKKVPDFSLYWRGITMDRFDGASWTNSFKGHETESFRGAGPRLTQTIYLEPYGNRYLFALDKPESFSLIGTKLRHSLALTLKEHINERIRYKATSVITEFEPDDLKDRARYLQLPEDFSSPMRNLVEKLTADQAENEKIRSLMQFLHAKDFKYSLESLPVSKTPLEDFLMRYKRGNCEYYASSLAVMLRMAGIPSRLVGGYRGGYYNPAGGYYLVLQKNAHVWVEAYTHGPGDSSGWLRLDPTPFSPQSLSTRYAQSFLLELRLLLDSFNYYWNKFVITYDFSRQMMIVNKLRESFQGKDFKFDLKAVGFKKYMRAGLGLALIGLAVAGGMGIRKRKERHERLLSRFLRRLASRGYKRKRGEGLEELVSRIEQKDLRIRAGIFVEEFQQVFYRDGKFSRRQIEHLENQIRSL